MREIPLTRGKVAIVDEADFWPLSAFKWHAHESEPGKFYAARMDGRKIVYMHRYLVPGIRTDHADRNTLNNQRYNLRPANASQNGANGPSRAGSSKWKGVSWQKDAQKWRAKIMKDGKSIQIGYFSDEVDAATAYNFVAEELFGEFASFNTADCSKCFRGLVQ